MSTPKQSTCYECLVHLHDNTYVHATYISVQPAGHHYGFYGTVPIEVRRWRHLHSVEVWFSPTIDVPTERWQL